MSGDTSASVNDSELSDSEAAVLDGMTAAISRGTPIEVTTATSISQGGAGLAVQTVSMRVAPAGVTTTTTRTVTALPAPVPSSLQASENRAAAGLPDIRVPAPQNQMPVTPAPVLPAPATQATQATQARPATRVASGASGTSGVSVAAEHPVRAAPAAAVDRTANESWQELPPTHVIVPAPPIAAGTPAEPAAARPDEVTDGHAGHHADSQDEQSPDAMPKTAASEPGAAAAQSLLWFYHPPLFNRRLESNGVDDALMLFIASIKGTQPGYCPAPIALRPVTATAPVMAYRDHVAVPAELPDLPDHPAQEKPIAWPRVAIWQSRFPLVNFPAVSRTLRAPLQQRPVARARRHRNPFMSDPRSTGVVERAAFWVRADMGWPGGVHPACHFCTISADCRTVRLQPLRLQVYALKANRFSSCNNPHHRLVQAP